MAAGRSDRDVLAMALDPQTPCFDCFANLVSVGYRDDPMAAAGAATEERSEKIVAIFDRILKRPPVVENIGD